MKGKVKRIRVRMAAIERYISEIRFHKRGKNLKLISLIFPMDLKSDEEEE